MYDLNLEESLEKVSQLSRKYCSFMPNNDIAVIRRNIVAELESWKLKWANFPDIESINACHLLQNCDS